MRIDCDVETHETEGRGEQTAMGRTHTENERGGGEHGTEGGRGRGKPQPR